VVEVSGSTVRADVFVGTSGPWPGSLTVEQEFIPVTSERSSRPDHRWVAVDNAGHWHAFTRDGKLPTLREYAEHVECDGSCGGICEGEGYHVTRWKCRACEKPVAPRFIQEYGRTEMIPGPRSWHVQLTAPTYLPVPQHRDQVSVRATFGDRIYFGLATLGDFSMTPDALDVTLLGTTELGERAS
jgi:hypothetical protein